MTCRNEPNPTLSSVDGQPGSQAARATGYGYDSLGAMLPGFSDVVQWLASLMRSPALSSLPYC